MGEIQPLGHDLDPDSDEDVGWLIAWAKEAEIQLAIRDGEIAALEAENRELREALRKVERTTMGRFGSDDKFLCELARAALKGGK